jgi:uncharacterized protein (TIGR02246 family)
MTSEESARAVVAQLQSALDDRDLARLVGFFHPDGILIGTSAYNQGADEIRAYLTLVMDQEESVRWDLTQVDTFLEEGPVIGFAGDGEIVVTGPDAEERLPFRLSIVAERGEADRWLIRHFHGSLPDGG